MQPLPLKYVPRKQRPVCCGTLKSMGSTMGGGCSCSAVGDLQRTGSFYRSTSQSGRRIKCMFSPFRCSHFVDPAEEIQVKETNIKRFFFFRKQPEDIHILFLLFCQNNRPEPQESNFKLKQHHNISTFSSVDFLAQQEHPFRFMQMSSTAILILLFCVFLCRFAHGLTKHFSFLYRCGILLIFS